MTTDWRAILKRNMDRVPQDCSPNEWFAKIVKLTALAVMHDDVAFAELLISAQRVVDEHLRKRTLQ